MVASAQAAPTDAIYINEIYVSPNNEQFDGIDWNGDGGPAPEPESEPEDEPWMDGPFYWIVIFAALVVIVGSIGVVNSNLRSRANNEPSVLVSEEE
jgi:hypothetical protein